MTNTLNEIENGPPGKHRQETAETAPNALAIHEAVRIQGEQELSRPVRSLAWSGLAAGLRMGLSLTAEGLLQAGLPEAPWRSLVASAGYTAGFLVVILGRQQLFTENTVTPVLPLLHSPDLAKGLSVLRLWSVVFAANLIGTILFAAMAALGDIFDEPTLQTFDEIGRRAAEPGFLKTFSTAVLAGWLIVLVVWIMPVAGSARFFIIFALTYLIALAHLAHVIAGSAEEGISELARLWLWFHCSCTPGQSAWWRPFRFHSQSCSS